MIIVCNKCNKKFEIDQNLIPAKGRMLQCGNCDHQWFFKFNITNEKNKDDEEIKFNDFVEEANDKELINKNDKSIKKQNKNKLNYFKFFFVLIISFIALILILETFKEYISLVLPDIKILLHNLYESLEDIKLFFIDLIN